METESVREWWQSQDPQYRIGTGYKLLTGALWIGSMFWVMVRGASQATTWNPVPIGFAMFHAVIVAVVGYLVYNYRTPTRILGGFLTDVDYENSVGQVVIRDWQLTLNVFVRYFPAIVAGLSFVVVVGSLNMFLLFGESGSQLTAEQMHHIVVKLVPLVLTLAMTQITLLAYLFNPARYIKKYHDWAVGELHNDRRP